MEPASNAYKGNLSATTKMVVLDYLFEKDNTLVAYQLIRFAPGEPWLILQEGELLGSIDKQNGNWIETGTSHLDLNRLTQIGLFIDKQHFNILPEKIKRHWPDQVQEVIMENDSAYMVVCKADIDFYRFRSVFSAYIGNLVEDEWEIVFKVYNAAFSDEFQISVYR